MKITALYRHPIKSHGWESLERVTLTEGQSMPFDRHWAIAHDAAKLNGAEWAPCHNFSRGAKAPKLMAINASLDEATGNVRLTHPERPEITLHPEQDAEKLLEWVTPLVPQDRALPAQVLTLADRGFTDAPFPSLSLCSTASHGAVESLGGMPLSPLRWRGNIWFDGAAPWDEMGWIGQDFKLGGAILHIEEPIGRCLATTANPETGERDADTLRTLKILGHQNFGVYAQVIASGDIAVGNTLEPV